MIPNKTDKIFELLSKGKFICQNYPDSNHKQLYTLVYDNYNELYEYFYHIGFILNKEHEYFYFSKDDDANKDNKLSTIIKSIDLLDFILEYQNDFTVNTKVSPSDILNKINENINLKNKLSKLDKRDTTSYQKCKKVLDDFVNKGLLALLDEEEEIYIVLNSFKYLEDFIESIKEVSNDPA